jgi:hypothetical protein
MNRQILLKISLAILCGYVASNVCSAEINRVSTILEGTWKKPCSPMYPENTGGLYDVITVTYTGTRFISVSELYTDANCTADFTPPQNVNIAGTISGTFSPGNTITVAASIQATEQDSHISQLNSATVNFNHYDIVYITENILYTGDLIGEKDAYGQETRPDTINLNRGFYRQ